MAKNMKSYIQLNKEQKESADNLTYLLGKSINDSIFKVLDDKSVDAVCDLVREQRFDNGWGFFCFEHRRAFERGQDCCDGENIYAIRYKSAADHLSGLQTLREQLNQD